MDKGTKVALSVSIVMFFATRDATATLVAGVTALVADMFL